MFEAGDLLGRLGGETPKREIALRDFRSAAAVTIIA
jgi:hypothetical protein